MRKFLLPLVVFLFCAGFFASANAQVTRLQAREAEWKNYALPRTNFTRQINPDKNFIFRVPADWQQEGSEFKFKGPHAATLEIGIQKIPDGYPFEDYFASVLQGVRDMPGATESLVTRKTQLQDLEAREIFLELPDAEGQLTRSTSWLAVQGPQALIFNLKVAAAHAAEVEPYFKAVVQSVIFVPFDYEKFETARNATIKTTASHPINEVDGIVASLLDTTSERDAAVSRLAALFSSMPEVAFDLLLDRRPLVRVAAVQAVGRSNNSSLTPLLWELLNDREPLVTEAAARGLSNSPDIVANLLQHSMSGFHTQKLARVWPFMPKEKRNELLQLIFRETVVGRTSPPPRVKAPPKSSVTVRVAEMTAVQPGKPAPSIGSLAFASQDPNVQIGALALLMSVPVDEFKMPLERIMAASYDPLIAVGLQVAIARGESLPVAPLLKLVLSSDKQVSTLAAQNLAFSASISDISSIETRISKNGARKSLDDELRVTIKKINFRHQLNSAKTEDERRELMGKSLSDSALADFAWRHHCEATVAGCTSALPKLDFTTKPFAENLFPQKVNHYTAIPNPRQAVQKFYGTLSGLQMDSPRAQSDFVLLLTSLRQLLGSMLSAPHDADALIDFTGIKPDSPIAVGSWTAPNAHNSSALAQRNAIVLRVKDRVRFERLAEKFQAIIGGVANFTEGVAVGTRAIAALPATLPFTAQAALSSDAFPTEGGPLLRYSLLADKEWNGLRIRTIEHVWINRDWTLQSDPTYLAYLGDTAILARDLATIRELFANATSDRPSLADNSAFRETIDSRGDVVYFSDLKAIFGDSSESNKNSSLKINERGALKFSGSSWENAHQLTFDASEWSKPLLPFHPKELTAPRELLPSSTIAYFLTKVELPLLWTASAKDLFS
ncbi:MAG TPA: HEAT repeat domain-containing protein, partial [Pyrinomonadaceae bacterium]|nr:HEAT repeat domain-containing protein [Pyrinomonadaceae bacterium]